MYNQPVRRLGKVCIGWLDEDGTGLYQSHLYGLDLAKRCCVKTDGEGGIVRSYKKARGVPASCCVLYVR